MYADEGCSRMEQVERVSELNIFCAVLLAKVERGTNLFHFLLCAQWPKTLELGIVERKTNWEHLREQIYRNKRGMIVIDVIDVDVGIATNCRSDRLVPSGVEDSRREVVHASRIRVSLRLCTEYRAIKDDIGNVVQDVGLYFNEVRLAEDNNLDGFRRVTGRVLEIFNLGHDPDKVNVRHCFAHES